MFIPVIFVIGQLPNAGNHRFIIACAAIAVWGLYFLVAKEWVIWIRCNHCGKDIATNTPWVCGVCKKTHTNASRFPFVGSCYYCGDEPKAYECHHCGELIFLSKDELKLNFATCANIPVETSRPKPVKKDPTAEEIAKLDKDIEITRRKVTKAELEVTLKEHKDVLEPIKPRTQKEAVEESFADYEDRNMTGAEIVRRKKAEVAEKYKNDLPELERQNRLIDQWARDHLDIM
jgi:hypothetical protein